ncbi:MazG-like family protein [Bacillus thuringiensis]|uniref:MazG-like family protein n=1 Tax=Bacillus thuringiensis TaxID=1428 RepID=UPI002541ED30|nr:MazG-like family protein [Bacillus thuringiensis]WIG15405.1 MazG-like family protein [Bacillus thuringiensis]
MTKNDQIKVEDFILKHNLKTSIETRMLDLLSEIGELAKEVLKGNNYGTNSLVLTEDWADELGDVYFAVLCLAIESNVNIHQALNDTIEKYNKRIAVKSNPGSE